MSAGPAPSSVLAAPGNRLRAAAVAVLGAGLGVALLVVPSAPAGAASAQRDERAATGVRLVHANIYTKLSVERFQADVATVLDQQPDLVTYNEVPFRSDAVMAPEGYSIWRDMRNRFTAATPVAWRSDLFTAVDQGVFRISNWRGKPPGREIELGRRFANWVTLQGVDGRVFSVVSIHIAPLADGMPDLLRRSVTRLGMLTDLLAPRGPVLVGGDFNVHYTSGRYPRDLLTPHELVPTFDTLGNHFPTGDHYGATIDYVYNRGADQLVATGHFPVELKSDHDAVVADLSWVTDPPTDTVVVRSDPAGEPAERRAVLARMAAGVRAAEPGSTVRVVTSRADLFALRARLKAAAQRGVVVQVSVTASRFSDPERKLLRQLRASGQQNSWVRRCAGACAEQWSESGAPRSLMLLSDVSGAWTSRYDTGRALTTAVVQRPTKLTVSLGQTALREADVLVRAVD